MKRQRLELLKTTDEMVHIISTPFQSEQGSSLAIRVAQACEGIRHTASEFCYNPNLDCPKTLGVSWLDTWMAICDNTVRTGGNVFVIFRSDGKGEYGCETKGPGSLDGEAQQGEIRHALSKGCHIHWLDATNPEAAISALRQRAERRSSKRPRSDGAGSSALAISDQVTRGAPEEVITLCLSGDLQAFDKLRQDKLKMALAGLLDSEMEPENIVIKRTKSNSLAMVGRCRITVEVDEQGWISYSSETTSSSEEEEVNVASSSTDGKIMKSVSTTLVNLPTWPFPIDKMDIDVVWKGNGSIILVLSLPKPAGLVLYQLAMQRVPQLLQEGLRCAKYSDMPIARLDDGCDMDARVKRLLEVEAKAQEAKVLPPSKVIGGSKLPTSSSFFAYVAGEPTSLLIGPAGSGAQRAPLLASYESRESSGVTSAMSDAAAGSSNDVAAGNGAEAAPRPTLVPPVRAEQPTVNLPINEWRPSAGQDQWGMLLQVQGSSSSRVSGTLGRYPESDSTDATGSFNDGAAADSGESVQQRTSFQMDPQAGQGSHNLQMSDTTPNPARREQRSFFYEVKAVEYTDNSAPPVFRRGHWYRAPEQREETGRWLKECMKFMNPDWHNVESFRKNQFADYTLEAPDGKQVKLSRGTFSLRRVERQLADTLPDMPLELTLTDLLTYLQGAAAQALQPGPAASATVMPLTPTMPPPPTTESAAAMNFEGIPSGSGSRKRKKDGPALAWAKRPASSQQDPETTVAAANASETHVPPLLHRMKSTILGEPRTSPTDCSTHLCPLPLTQSVRCSQAC